MPSPWAPLWSLDPATDFLNHGSFGACPLAVLEHQRELQRRLERDPVAFLLHDLEARLDEARRAVAEFVNADPLDLVFVNNATTAVNAVLASLPLGPGDEVLVTDHGYPACTNAARRWASRAGASVVTVRIPFPVASAGSIVERVLAAVTDRTRLALLDHVTSTTALIFPVEELIRELRARGVPCLIDGAHAPGMLALDVEALGADYYTGNLHKWCCAPKGAAFLWARRACQASLLPLVTSHGASSARTDRPRFWLEFDWTGTSDPSAVLSAPFALRYLAGLVDGGWPVIRSRNRQLALDARRLVAARLGVSLPSPDELIGSMAALPLVLDAGVRVSSASPYVEPVYSRLVEQGFQVMIVPWPALPRAVLRLSAHLYNDLSQYERLARVLASRND